MLSALVSLKSLVKNKSYHIDHPVFRLHYQATVCGLLGFCLILTAKILFGDTIDCKGSTRDDFFDNLCYSLGTYTTYAVDPECADMDALANKNSSDLNSIQEYFAKQFRLVHRLSRNPILCHSSDIQYIYSGIQIPRDLTESLSVTFWHKYYRYIPMILFLQAVFFYLPHYLWKVWENGIVSSVCKQLHDHRFSPNEFIESNYNMVDYIQNCFTLNKSLVYKYYLCHIFLMINLVVQILALDAILNDQFITYGLDVIYYRFINDRIYGLKKFQPDPLRDAEVNHPMDFVFPKVTACTAETLSAAGGTPNQLQFLCVLPLNILYDKFFLTLWFWLVILGVITVLQLVYDALYITLPPLRKYLFERKFGSYLSSSSPAELFMLDLIGTNSDKFAFTALMRKLNKEEWHLSSPSESESLV